MDIDYSTDPWPIWTIDNFFLEEDYKTLTEFVDRIDEKISAVDKTKHTKFSFEIRKIDAVPQLLDSKTEELVNSLYYCIPRTVATCFNKIGLDASIPGSWSAHLSRVSPGYVDKIHCDSYVKLFSFVVYIGEEGEGTNIYDGPSESNLKYRVQWKPNRAILFQKEEGVTWHAVPPVAKDRYSLVLSLNRGENFGDYFITDTPKEILDESL